MTVTALAIFGVYCNKTANDDVNYATFFSRALVCTVQRTHSSCTKLNIWRLKWRKALEKPFFDLLYFTVLVLRSTYFFLHIWILQAQSKILINILKNTMIKIYYLCSDFSSIKCKRLFQENYPYAKFTLVGFFVYQ